MTSQSVKYLTRIQANFEMLRRNTQSLDVDRETFEKNQTISLQKATSTTECAAKEKHVRNAILGSYHDKGAMMFWHISQKLPMSTEPIVAWKFCHVLHKVLRDGHPRVLKDSLQFKQYLKDLGRVWNHGGNVYPRLIGSYLKCLSQRIDFHNKYEVFPGNLLISEEDLENYKPGDANAWAWFLMNREGLARLRGFVFEIKANLRLSSFELSVDLLDTLDLLLDLQKKVFNTLDMSRAVSLTGPGQCRLAPCILVILDTSQLYDHVVKTLFRLHEYLPSDALSGHRHRFHACFDDLKVFYRLCSNLQYFKKLIQVPSLPDTPPDFLIKSSDKFELGPVQVLEDAESDGGELSPKPIVDDLIDTGCDVDDEPFFQRDWRDDEIEMLRNEIEQLKAELVLMQAENRQEISRLLEKIDNLKQDLLSSNAVVTNATSELTRLRQHAEEGKAHLQAAEAAQSLIKNVEKKALGNEEIYKKLKEKHLALVKEHANLLRKDAEMKKLTESVQENLGRDSDEAEKMKEEIDKLKRELELYLAKQRDLNKKSRGDADRLLDSAIAQACGVIRSAIASLDGANENTCSAESLMRIVEQTAKSLERVAHDAATFRESIEIHDLIRSLSSFGHSMSHSIVNGGATCNMAAGNQGTALRNSCRNCGNVTITYLNDLKTNDQSESVRRGLEEIMLAARELLPKMSDVKGEDLDDLVGQEMASTARAVEQAAERIEALLNEARKRDSGANLEVNERILDSCTELMKMIKILIASAKELQREIVVQGKGSSTAKEFYMKNSRWTEGLISAAKAVGWGATMLTDSADVVIQGSGKFEELLVWSHEIAASTAQLVAASRVKASNASKKLLHLESASKGVNSATGKVVTATNAGRRQLEGAGDLLADISNIASLTQIKRKEMDSQVKLLALEKALEQERRKLGTLRKKHYELNEIRDFEEGNQKPKASSSKPTPSEKPLIAVKPVISLKPNLPPKPKFH